MWDVNAILVIGVTGIVTGVLVTLVVNALAGRPSMLFPPADVIGGLVVGERAAWATPLED